MNMDKCIKKICGWTGTDDDKKRVVDHKASRESGVLTHILVCPKCGCRSFYEVGDSTKLSGPKKQRGYMNFSMMDFLVCCAVIGFVGWLVIEGFIWLFSHIDISWVS